MSNTLPIALTRLLEKNSTFNSVWNLLTHMTTTLRVGSLLVLSYIYTKQVNFGRFSVFQLAMMRVSYSLVRNTALMLMASLVISECSPLSDCIYVICCPLVLLNAFL